MANPFKKVEDFENEINEFLKKNKTFISNQGKRISDYFEMSCYNYIVRFYQNQGFTLHCLRHTIATQLLEQGMELEKVRDFLGHEYLGTTQIYTHIRMKNETINRQPTTDNLP